MAFFRYFLLLILWLSSSSLLSSQTRTVGVISVDSSNTVNGHNLLFPHFQPNVYLIDECGRVLHQWDDVDHTPGNIAYLSPTGNLYKGKKPNTLPTPTFGAGGAGGIVEVLDWDNNVLWSGSWMDSVYRQHHDISIMPNGNLLIIAWERFRGQEVLDKGAAIPERWGSDEIWSEAIFEIDYVHDTIVWEWHAWDHTIQDEDNTKANFGVVADHPEKIDINYAANTAGRPDWLHINSIDYNPELDQILLSVPYLDEIWIIDHSTTSEQAATSMGGNSGKGGGILYRWGNPESYANGTDDDRQLFFQHDANWIDDVADDHPYKDKISIFNNRVEDSLSVAIIIDPAFDAVSGAYPQNDLNRFEPSSPLLSLVHPDTITMYSSGLSSFQVLDNDNFLICSGRNGYSFEMDKDQNIYWEYRTPFQNGVPVDQGVELAVNDNITFKMRRYPLDYAGFSNLDNQSLNETIELNNPSDFCNLLTPTIDIPNAIQLDIFPNPTASMVTVGIPNGLSTDIVLYNVLGARIRQWEGQSGDVLLDLSDLDFGVYFLQTPQLGHIEKIVVSE